MHLNVFFEQWWPIIVGGAAAVLLGTVGLLFFRRPQMKKSPIAGQDYVAALGGKTNIVAVKATYSRLSAYVRDLEIVDQARLRELGATSIITMSDRLVILLGEKAGAVASAIETELKS